MTNKFSDCLLIVNSLSANHVKAEALFTTQLNEIFGKSFSVLRLTHVLLKEPGKLDKHLNKLSKTSLLAIIGGDGTVSLIINELFNLPNIESRKATVLPLWGGNANDLAHMANGYRRNLRHILKYGKSTSINPIEFKIEDRQIKTGYAINYLSFGAIATGAAKLDNSKLVNHAGRSRAARLVSEVVIGFAGLAKAKRFKIATNQKNEIIYDLLLINGSRIAKLYHTPIKLSQNGFLHLKIRYKHPILINHVLSLAKSHLKSTPVRTVNFKLLQPTSMQRDGEVYILSESTNVQVSVAKQPIRLLMTK